MSTEPVDDVGLTTAAVYPEVRELLERPDRIRREAFKLLERGELFKFPELRGKLRFIAYRDRGGHDQAVQVDVDNPDPHLPVVKSEERMAEIRKAILEKLIVLLESDVSGG